jgi:YHS domain-containing protein
MTAKRTIEPNEDPVCGMTVDPDTARARGLALTHEGTEYVLCGKGCLLEFRDDPGRYLEASYTPAM